MEEDIVGDERKGEKSRDDDVIAEMHQMALSISFGASKAE